MFLFQVREFSFFSTDTFRLFADTFEISRNCIVLSPRCKSIFRRWRLPLLLNLLSKDLGHPPAAFIFILALYIVGEHFYFRRISLTRNWRSLGAVFTA